MSDVPLWLAVLFALITSIVLGGLLQLIKTPLLSYKRFLFFAIGLLLCCFLQLGLAASAVYSTALDALPPRIFLFGILPPLLLIFVFLFTAKGRAWMHSLSLQSLTLIHTTRVGVELVLFFLFGYAAVPQLMTFEGRNFDVLTGLTAPLIWYFVFVKKAWGRNALLVWNVLGLLLLLNIVLYGLLSAPTPVQRFGFNQPNIAVLHAPYVLLPTFIVPVMLFCHLAALLQLTRTSRTGTDSLYKSNEE